MASFVSASSKLRLTGGEPLLRRNLPQLVERLARIEGLDDIALTTNGSLLAKQAQALRDAGLHRLTVSLDTLDPTRFRELSGGRGELDAVLAGIAAAETAGFGSIKFNCVVQRGVNEGDAICAGRSISVGPGMWCATSNTWMSEPAMAGDASAWCLPQNCAIASPRVATAAAVDPGYRGRSRFAAYCVRADGAVRRSASAVRSPRPSCGDCHRARVSADGPPVHLPPFADEGHDLVRWQLAQGDGQGRSRRTHRWLCGRTRADRYSEVRGALSDDPVRSSDPQAH